MQGLNESIEKIGLLIDKINGATIDEMRMYILNNSTHTFNELLEMNDVELHKLFEEIGKCETWDL